jgi:hypothetical protein
MLVLLKIATVLLTDARRFALFWLALSSAMKSNRADG